MTGITIVGLGPGRAELLTREAWRTLASATEIWLRTARHPAVAGLPSGPSIHDFDALYEAADDFGGVYAAIAARVIDLGARPEGVIYAVPGSPSVAEATVGLIRAEAAARGLPCRLIAGLSFIEPVLQAL